MKKGVYRGAVFILIYSKKEEKIKYLLLKRHLHWKGWEFPKGGIKRFELRRFTIKRELKEETSLSPRKIKGFNIKGKYDYAKEYPDRLGIKGQTYKLYAVEVNPKSKIKIDIREHSGYRWVSFKEAIKKLTWKNQRDCIKIVDKWLKSK